MRIIILKTNEVETACDVQEKDCQGINCKTCQFNKIGVDIEYLKQHIYKNILSYLMENRIDIYDQAKGLSELVIDILLKEESDQAKIGFHIFKKVIH